LRCGQVQGLDAQAINLADKTQYEELYHLVQSLDGRLTRLESRFDKMELNYSSNLNELHKNINADRETIQNRFTSLIERMNSLENAVESEHETSLDLLEVLIQKSEKKQLRNGTGGEEGGGRGTGMRGGESGRSAGGGGGGGSRRLNHSLGSR
jgi:uncharacterized membrane protein YgcG